LANEEELDLRIELLDSRHHRAVFSCAVEELDRYLHKQARQDLSKRVAAVFVATPDGSTVAGYYTLSAHTLNLGDLPEEAAKRLPKYPHVPVTLLGRLAVDTRFRGRKVGEFLLLDALRRALAGTKQVASAAVVVDAKNAEARRFYARYDFISLPSQPMRMFYLMRTIAKLFPGDAG
jgi:predicted GNAT family N-acyltransferase